MKRVRCKPIQRRGAPVRYRCRHVQQGGLGSLGVDPIAFPILGGAFVFMLAVIAFGAWAGHVDRG